METLTKKQRHEIYKDALTQFEWKCAWQPPICSALSDSLLKLHNIRIMRCRTIQSLFIEFALFNPLHEHFFWFEDDYQRNICLMLCIEMTR